MLEMLFFIASSIDRPTNCIIWQSNSLDKIDISTVVFDDEKL